MSRIVWIELLVELPVKQEYSVTAVRQGVGIQFHNRTVYNKAYVYYISYPANF